jgi:hypothetical protein
MGFVVAILQQFVHLLRVTGYNKNVTPVEE